MKMLEIERVIGFNLEFSDPTLPLIVTLYPFLISLFIRPESKLKVSIRFFFEFSKQNPRLESYCILPSGMEMLLIFIYNLNKEGCDIGVKLVMRY